MSVVVNATNSNWDKLLVVTYSGHVGPQFGLDVGWDGLDAAFRAEKQHARGFA